MILAFLCSRYVRILKATSTVGQLLASSAHNRRTRMSWHLDMHLGRAHLGKSTKGRVRGKTRTIPRLCIPLLGFYLMVSIESKLVSLILTTLLVVVVAADSVSQAEGGVVYAKLRTGPRVIRGLLSGGSMKLKRQNSGSCDPGYVSCADGMFSVYALDSSLLYTRHGVLPER